MKFPSEAVSPSLGTALGRNSYCLLRLLVYHRAVHLPLG